MSLRALFQSYFTFIRIELSYEHIIAISNFGSYLHSLAKPNLYFNPSSMLTTPNAKLIMPIPINVWIPILIPNPITMVSSSPSSPSSSPLLSHIAMLILSPICSPMSMFITSRSPCYIIPCLIVQSCSCRFGTTILRLYRHTHDMLIPMLFRIPRIFFVLIFFCVL